MPTRKGNQSQRDLESLTQVYIKIRKDERLLAKYPGLVQSSETPPIIETESPPAHQLEPHKRTPVRAV